MPITVIVFGNIISHCLICITEDNACCLLPGHWCSPVFAEKQCWDDGEGGGGQGESRQDGAHCELHWQLADFSETSVTVAADTPRIETKLSGNLTDIAPLSYPLVLKQFWNVHGSDEERW